MIINKKIQFLLNFYNGTLIRKKIYALFSKLTLTLLLTMSTGTCYAQLIINELMQSNINTFCRNGFIPESWVELYNPTDSIVFLKNYKLGPTPSYDEAFIFNNMWAILPMCYETISCDKTYGNIGMNLETDGGKLFLFDNHGVIIDSVYYEEMKMPDVSWGREPNEDHLETIIDSIPSDTVESVIIVTDSIPSDTVESVVTVIDSIPSDTVESVVAVIDSIPSDTVESVIIVTDSIPSDTVESVVTVIDSISNNANVRFGTMLNPTPNRVNSIIVDKLPSKVKFSVDGGIWEKIDPFYVELTANNVPNYYADSVEVDSSLCIRYTLDGSEPSDSSPIYTEPLYINTTTFIRAKVFDSTKPLFPSNSVSYINHGRPVDKNVVSIITDSLYFYGKEEGIMGNRNYAEWGYRRPMNFEYFPLDNEQKSINTLCKGRAGGNVSRVGDPYINIVLYAKKGYGDKHFKTKFWTHQKPLIKENKSIYLRCGDKQTSFLRDAINLNIASLLDIDYLATDALSVYLNGNFYGLLYMYERSNEDYIWANYNKLKDVDLISIEGSQNGVVKTGTIDEFNKFKVFWQSAPHSLNEWRKWMDIDEYTDVMALELFSANKDFWYNNIRLYKSRLDSSAVWRWIANDFDYTFNDFFDNSYLKWALEDDVIHKSEDYGSQLWRALIESDEYRSYFLDRIIAYHGDFLNKTTYCACVDSLHKLTDFETQLTVQMYYGGKTEASDHNILKECITKRSDYFHTDLQTFFNLGDAVKIKVNMLSDEEDLNENNKIDLYYNNIKLKTGSFDGWDFVDRTLSIQAKNNDVIEPMNWIVEKVKDNVTEIERYTNIDMLTYVIPTNYDSIVFTSVSSDYKSSLDNIKSLTDIEILKTDHSIVIWDIYGRVLYHNDKKQNIVLPKKTPLIISIDGNIQKIML